MTLVEQPIEQQRGLTCFVTAPIGVSITGVTHVLQQRGVTPVTIADLGANGVPLFEQISDAISRVDLFVAVLGRKESNGNILVELGYASAVHKPILIVAPPGSEALPSSLAGLPQVAADVQNAEAL